MSFIVYKTTNLLNSRFYVGVHNGKSKNYFGTGRLLKSAIKKYGKENFKRETLIECDTAEEAYDIESMIVKTVKEDPRSYNLEPGGLGNSNLGKSVVENKIGIHSATFEQRSEWSKKTQEDRSKEELFKMSSKGGTRCSELGKSHFMNVSEEQRKEYSIKAEKTKIELGIKSSFHDPVLQSRNGRKGGKTNFGLKSYTDGSLEYKFRSSNVNDTSITEKEFCVFLENNKQFRRGRKDNFNSHFSTIK